MEKEKLIKKELKKLIAIYEPILAEKAAIVMPMLENAAFMKVTMDELQAIINKAGCSEQYKNGENQFGRKATAEISAYNQLMKTYTALFDRLDKALPKGTAKSKLESLMSDG